MKKKSRILVATDYSDAAINAGRYAVQFAESICAELCFIHVYEMTMSSIPTEPLEFSRARIGLSQGELKTLEQHCSNLFASMNRSKNKTGCECVVREGRVANEISEEAKKNGSGFHCGRNTWSKRDL